MFPSRAPADFVSAIGMDHILSTVHKLLKQQPKKALIIQLYSATP